MAYRLSTGAIETIMTGGSVNDPVLQILDYTQISGESNIDRYRLVISDGVHLSSFAMLSGLLTNMITKGEIIQNTIVSITNHDVVVMKNQEKGNTRIMVILGVEVLQHVAMRIGSPVKFTDAQKVQQSNFQKSYLTSSESNNLFQAQNEVQAFTGYSIDSTPSRLLIDTVYNTPVQPIGRSHPITSLHPYINNWTIKARVISKTPIRHWCNAQGEGSIFSVDLVDESGAIRGTAFKEDVDKFYDLLQENKVYYISKCLIKSIKESYLPKINDYEIIFRNDTRVVLCLEGDHTIPSLHYNFVRLNQVEDREKDTFIDCIGVCVSTSDIFNLTSSPSSSQSRRFLKREVTLVDSSLTPVSLTLWSTQAEEFNGDNNPIVAVKGAKITEFQGVKSLSVVNNSDLKVNPDIPEARRLRDWFNSEDVLCISTLTEERAGTIGACKNYTLREAIDQKFGYGEKADYFNCYATVKQILREKCIYKACPAQRCNKKVIEKNTGQYYCEKCNEDYDNFKYGLVLKVNIEDFSGNHWISIFQETGEKFLDAKAEAIGRWQEEDNALFNKIFKKVTLKPYQFTLRANLKPVGDEICVNYTAISIKKPNYKRRCRQLMSEIKELSDFLVNRKN